MIITYSGTDGSGKSTQIDLLAKKIQSQNKQTRCLWARGGYTPFFVSLKNIVRIVFREKLPTSGDSKKREDLIRKNSVSSLWLTISTIDLFLYLGIYARYLNLTGKIVICDRYIKDTQIDFKRNFSSQFNEDGFLWRMLVRLVPEPDYRFLLYVPVNVSLVRSKMKNEPFPDSPETLYFRLESYMDESLFPSNKYHKIDCQQSVEAIQEEIQKVIFNTP